MDITFTDMTTVTRSMDDSFQSEIEQLKDEIKKLKLKVERLEEEKKRVEPLVKLYERVKEVKNGSGQMIINPNLTRLNIVLERYYLYLQYTNLKLFQSWSPSLQVGDISRKVLQHVFKLFRGSSLFNNMQTTITTILARVEVK